MKISSIEQKPIHQITYQFVESGSGSKSTKALLVHEGRVNGLPPELDGILVTSDLQGVDPKWQNRSTPRLIGQALAEELLILSELGEIPPAKRIGVILPGDFYVSRKLDKRGGKGDVRDIWLAFHKGFRWVAGVAGNHDQFGSHSDLEEFRSLKNLHYLDGDVVDVDGVEIGGIGGIIGRPSKPFRREEQDFLSQIETVMNSNPDLLILHEGPDFPTESLPGSATIRECLESCPSTLVTCGHSHWDTVFQQLSNGTQVLNVDARAVLLMADKPEITPEQT